MGLGFVASVITWFISVSIVDDLPGDLNALYVQAATGLVAILVLLIVTNGFFHKLHWTGWISLHNRRKQQLLESAKEVTGTQRRILFGMVALGFTSFYREGVKVVLFLRVIGSNWEISPFFMGCCWVCSSVP